MRVFADGYFDDYLREREQAMISQIRAESESYILNVNSEDYIAHCVEQYSVDVPAVLRERVSIETHEEEIPAEQFPFGFNVYAGKSYPKPVITYHVPIEGDLQLLRFIPSPRLLWAIEMGVVGESVTFDLVVWGDDPEPIKLEAEHTINNLETQIGHLADQARTFNEALPVKVSGALQARRDELAKRSSLVEALGVPLRKRDDLPRTFSVPPPAQRKRIVPKPEATPAKAPEPTLDESAYDEILQTIWDLGTTMERLPSTYSGKDEETLRDHILLYLTPRFEGSATGETFNKAGKTDILLRYENSNVFIAECKFWSGAKGFLETIDQLLGYLTWRDSKACVVLFVRNKDFSGVLAGVKATASKHPEYVRFVRDRGESWFEYRFRIPGDSTREVWINVLAFHLPG